MRRFPRPVVVVSECLGFAHCRWNGLIVPDAFVAKLGAHVAIRPLCPEVAIGLGTPREPLQTVRQGGELRLIQPATSRDLTEAMRSFSATFLDKLDAVDGFILKSRSPSCGLWDTRVHRLTDEVAGEGESSGLFAGEVLARFSHLAMEDEVRLKDLGRREHFLTRLFALAAFRERCASSGVGGLARFHWDSELLLRAYHPGESRILGEIVANPRGKPSGQVIAGYRRHLHRALSRPPGRPSSLAVLQEALERLSTHDSSADDAVARDCLEEYRSGNAPLSHCLRALASWAVRSQHEYLMGQTILQPYPEALMEPGE